MKKAKWIRWLAACLAVVLLIGTVAATLGYDLNGDGKTNIWDLQLALQSGASAQQQQAALQEVLGGGDELHKNQDGQWEIWTSLGLYNMAKHAQAGDTFVLMQDIDMAGAFWTPIAGFQGTLLGNMHSISNLKLTRATEGSMGLFADIAQGSHVEYLNLKDVNLIAAEDAVNIGLLTGTCAGTIDGCTSTGFVTDNRTTLPGNVYIGGLAGKLEGSGAVISRDKNKLPKDSEETIYTISSKLGTRFADLTGDTYTRTVGIVGDLSAGTVDAGTLLQDLTGIMPDPNCLAWVTNGDVTVYPHTLEEILSLVRSDGNTVITLQKDLSNSSSIKLPYSCTLDCNGYTIRTNPTSGNGLNVNAIGTENQILTVKNGTLLHYEIGIRVSAGGVIVSNMTIVAYGGAPIGLYDTNIKYTDVNLIENSTLVSENWGCITFNLADQDMTGTGITIRDSALIASKAGGNNLFIARASQPGTVTLGTNVDLYTYKTSVFSSVDMAGVEPLKLDNTATMTVCGKEYANLSHWTTDESLISTEVIAQVTNGAETVQVTNISDMTALVSVDGNTRIKLVKDLNLSSQLSLPYSCSLDLNGHTINSTSNAIRILAVGTENTTTKIQNGTIRHSVLGLRVNTGSIDLSNVQLIGNEGSGYSIAFYDPNGAYRADNKIENCTIYNPLSPCIRYNVADTDFVETGISIENSTLIASKSYVFSVATARMSGVIDLGEHVQMYSNNTTLAPNYYRYAGNLAGLTKNASVTADSTELTGLNHWSTDLQKEAVDILLIGNSLSTAIPDDIYGIATAAGYTVNVGFIYYPGCYSWWHWDWLNDDSPNYQYRIYNEMGLIHLADLKTSKEALAHRQWEHISFQDWFVKKYSGTMEDAYANHQESTMKYLNYLNTQFPDARIYYYQHWAWQVGHDTVPDVATQEYMFNIIKTASHQFSQDAGVALIPCGEAWELARDDDRIGDTMCQDDKLHDSAGNGGNYINACTFFEVMFGQSCIGNTYRASNGPSNEKCLILQQHAHNAVAAVHGEDYAK